MAFTERTESLKDLQDTSKSALGKERVGHCAFTNGVSGILPLLEKMETLDV